MTDKERAVIEAARLIDGFVPHTIIKGGEFCFSCDNSVANGHEEYCPFYRLEKAFEALDAEQENDMEDYKWMAMDEDGQGVIFTHKPYEFEDGYFLTHHGSVAEDNQPSFLKPGQLWERMCRDNDISKCWIGFEWWNGYWWRLVEDHSPTESLTCTFCHETFSGSAQDGKCTRCAGEGEWITDHRPTYDDAWSAIEGAMCPEVMVWDRFGASRCCWDQVGGRPWQPVPLCLRTPPQEPKCEECVHYQERDEATCCWLVMRFDPIYGMSGCQFKRRGE